MIMVDTTRYIKPTGTLESDLPRSNIVRIEILDGDSRDRFLKSQTSAGTGTNIYTLTNELRKETIGSIYTGSRENEKIFYGFLNPSTDSTFNLGSTWEASSLGGNIGESIKKVIGATGTIGKGVNAAINIGSSFSEIANKTMGLNTTATGASTMKEFKSVELDDFKVSCVWYLPEQEKLAKFSLRILYRMLYPKQIAQDSVGKLVGAGVTKIIDGAVDTAQDVISDVSKAAGANLIAKILGNDKPPTSADKNSPPSTVAEITGDVARFASGVHTGINNFFGANTTINPLPVRVCVGQHIDVEPLVITGISTKFSKETFISEIQGRHLPLFAYTTISFKYWLTPAPNLQFVNILGTEIFGDDMITYNG